MSEELEAVTETPTETTPEAPATDAGTTDNAGATSEATDQTTAEAQAEVDAQEASFKASFNRASGEPEPEAPAEPEIAGYTPDQIREAIGRLNTLTEEREQAKKREDRLNGAVGFLTRELKAIKEKEKAQPGTPVKLTKDSFKRLAEAYPELAESIAEDLSEAMSSSASSAPAVDIEATVQKAVKEHTKALETQRLDERFPDWRNTVNDAEFGKFAQSWSDQERDKFLTSINSDFIGGKLTAFSEWKAKARAAADTSERNLKRAIVPKGITSPPTGSTTTAEDAFRRSFNKTMKGR